MSTATCKDCGKAIHQTAEKAADGTFAVVWMDNDGAWICWTKEEHAPGVYDPFYDPRNPVSAIRAGAFAISTIQDPGASVDRDLDWLEANAEAIKGALTAISDWIKSRGEGFLSEAISKEIEERQRWLED